MNLRKSMYSHAWELLKETGSVTLMIDSPALAARIFKAIRKRKNLDVTFNAKVAAAREVWRLSSHVYDNKQLLTVKLTKSVCVKDI